MNKNSQTSRALCRLAIAGAMAGPVGPALAAGAEPAPCRLRGIEHQAICGSVQRPLDSARPQATQIDVHYAVLPALARNKQPDPVVFLAGGPGQSAIDIAPAVSAMLARFANRRDIVLVDQRGTGRSAPLLCDADDPALPLAEQFSLERQRERLAACRVGLGALPHGDLRYYTTTLAMQDVDAVRAALGASRINLVGRQFHCPSQELFCLLNITDLVTGHGHGMVIINGKRIIADRL